MRISPHGDVENEKERHGEERKSSPKKLEGSGSPQRPREAQKSLQQSSNLSQITLRESDESELRPPGVVQGRSTTTGEGPGNTEKPSWGSGFESRAQITRKFPIKEGRSCGKEAGEAPPTPCPTQETRGGRKGKQDPLAADSSRRTTNKRGFSRKSPPLVYDNELAESQNSASETDSGGEPEGWGGKQIPGRGSLPTSEGGGRQIPERGAPLGGGEEASPGPSPSRGYLVKRRVFPLGKSPFIRGKGPLRPRVRRGWCGGKGGVIKWKNLKIQI